MNADRILHEAHLRYQRQQQAETPELRKAVRRVAPAASALVVWRSMSDAYRAMFCEHGKAMWSECGSCKRDKRAASANFSKLVASRVHTRRP